MTAQQQDEAVDEDPDSLLEELERDLDDQFDLGGFRERRMEELKFQYVSAARAHDGGGGGGWN